MHFRKIILISNLLLVGASGAAAQTQAQEKMPGMDMPEEKSSRMNDAGRFLMRRASGTSANPESAPMRMLITRAGGWRLMLHGEGFLSEVQQTGTRGGDKFLSTNWFMGEAEHDIGRGAFTARAMLSLEPATVTGRFYPELFQTGETSFGRPLVDGQHPHDLFMELSFSYAQTLGEKTTLEIYFAPVGDPALGPVAFPHRVSAVELPQAPLSHHLQDSTHIANEVITGAIHRPHWGLEVSGFHGGEPNENRWNIDAGAIDSWSTRLSWTPGRNWSAQVSAGRLHNPEAIEPGDVLRTTASVTYNRPYEMGDWATSFIWGRNHKTATHGNTNSYLLESVVRFRMNNYLTGRIELLDRDELFADQPAILHQLAESGGTVFRIAAFTGGYTRDFHLVPHLVTGIGGNISLYKIPAAIQPFYGAHPAAFYLFLRFRLEGKGGGTEHRRSMPAAN